MTKYICECASLNSLHTCTCEADGMPPKMCCISGCRIEGWRKSEEQEVETPAPKLPEWCKVGAWVWFSGAKDIGYEPGYLKITDVGYNGMENVIDAEGDGIISMPLSVVKQARLRPWNDDELKSKVGKVFEMGNGDLTLCLGYQRDIADLIFVGKLMSAQSFAESDWRLDSLPCGVLEHKNDQGEWVK